MNQLEPNRQESYEAIDPNGKIVFTNNGEIDVFFEEKAAFYHSLFEKYGYIDQKGKKIIAPQFNAAGRFNNGKAVVNLSESQFALIDTSGNVIKEFNFYDVDDISEGLMVYQPEKESKYGYLSEDGSILIEPRFDRAENFEFGMAVVGFEDQSFDTRFGVINKKGEMIIERKYHDIIILNQNLIAVGVRVDEDIPLN